MARLLELRDVEVCYGSVPALRGVSLGVEQGEIAALIGANGAGKSTALMTICGIRRPSRGEILLRGEPIQHLPPHEIVVRGVAQVPEGRMIFPELSVRENLDLGAYLRRRDRAGVRRDLDFVLGLFPVLAERRGQPGGTLSGGEQQMLALGRALMAAPSLLLLDEPSMGLAPLVARTIFSTIATLAAERGVTILLVEQNANLALGLASRGSVLENGRVVLAGPCENLLANERVKRAYLGF
jgi:branched-chain amino acid transport system ATP-binding protein